jgi:hypothetical protein
LSDDLNPEQIADITAYVDIAAPPPDTPTAHLIFGTNQSIPAELVAERYHRDLAPLVIVTGGVNRHNGIIEGQEFYRILTSRNVPPASIRIEDHSANTWQNVELSLPYLHEALAMGLPITVVGKWYHRRAVHALLTLLPEAKGCYAIAWEPVYADIPIARDNWPTVPDGKRRVVREWEEVARRVADGSYREAVKRNGAWMG